MESVLSCTLLFVWNSWENIYQSLLQSYEAVPPVTLQELRETWEKELSVAVMILSGKMFGPMQDQSQYVLVSIRYNLRFCTECMYL